MKYQNISLLLCAAFLLSACSGVDEKQQPAPVYEQQAGYSPEQPVESELNTNAFEVDDTPIHTEPLFEDESETTSASLRRSSASPAVIALMSNADASSQSGDLETAVSTVERALRIEPRNPVLVYKLASLRLEQNKPGLAEDLAKKSALLAGDDRALKKSCWLLIADARERQGDQYGAAEAKKKAAKY